MLGFTRKIFYVSMMLATSTIALRVLASDRVNVAEKGFSIQPPAGWTVETDHPRLSLFMQAPDSAPGVYPRNISVTRFKGPKLINAETAEEFSTYIVKTWSGVSSEISNYQLRNHQPIAMADGRPGILFYTDFNAQDKPMMQAHILVSSQTNHYILSYTDIAEHFDNSQSSGDALAEAWNSITSVELDSDSPRATDAVAGPAVIASAVLVFLFGMMFWRNRRATELYRSYANVDDHSGLPLSEGAEEMSQIKTNASTSFMSRLTGKLKSKVISHSKTALTGKSIEPSLLDSKVSTQLSTQFSTATKLPKTDSGIASLPEVSASEKKKIIAFPVSAAKGNQSSDHAALSPESKMTGEQSIQENSQDEEKPLWKVS